MSLRILQLIDYMVVGGAQLYVDNLSRWLTDRGAQVTVCCLDAGRFALGERLRRDGYEVLSVGARWRFSASALARLVRLVRARRFDVVHSHLFRSDLHALAAAELTGTPALISTEHSSGSRRKRSPAFGRLFRLTASRFDRIIAVSEQVAQHLRRWSGVDGGRVVVIANGIDARAYRALPAGPAGGGERVVGFIGRFEPRKGVPTLIEAAAMLGRRRGNARFRLVGDGRGRREAEAQAAAAGLDGRIEFAGSRSDIPRTLGEFDVFVLPSYSEGLSIALLEAMAAGRPIVATAVGGTPEAIEHGRSGLLVGPGDAPALAGAIERLLDDPALARRLGENARQRVDERFTIEANAERVWALYHKALAERAVHRLGGRRPVMALAGRRANA
jgi:glycosyltransferase involved in cell wall biosynthesis